MPPKGSETPIAQLGTVAEVHGSGYRAQCVLTVDGQKKVCYGPSRKSKPRAQADLEHVRTASSRDAMQNMFRQLSIMFARCFLLFQTVSSHVLGIVTTPVDHV